MGGLQRTGGLKRAGGWTRTGGFKRAGGLKRTDLFPQKGSNMAPNKNASLCNFDDAFPSGFQFDSIRFCFAIRSDLPTVFGPKNTSKKLA